jgi:asparagine synthase (glutamine-hydrolysing)
VSWLELNGYMRNTLLRDSDVFSMAHHLELRVPFLDPAVVGAAMAAADDEKLASGAAKPLLVAALADLLPREVWDRPKRGFALPFEHWLRAELRDDVAAVFRSDDRLRRVGLAPAAAREVWADFLARRKGVTWSRPWALYTLVRWAEQLGAFASETNANNAAGAAGAAAARAAIA